MPPLGRMVVTALEDLASQLRFAPAEALRRDIERAEVLAGQVSPDGAYDEAWIVEQITGYRPALESPASIVGAALLADLSAFVERLCVFASLTGADLPAGSLEPHALAARWGVSRKTLDRYRKRGLVARRVMGGDAKVRLAFTPAVVGAFEARHRPVIEKAGGFTRIGVDDEARMVRRAAVYRRRFNCTLNQAAKRLADRFGRSHEAVRQVLRRHDESLPPSNRVFTEPGPPDRKFERVAWRAWRRGLEASALVERSGRSKVSVGRAVNHERARVVRAALDRAPALASAAAAPSKEVERVLASAPAMSGLGTPATLDALAWVKEVREGGVPLGVEERARGQAYHLLLARARASAAGLSASTPEAERLDQIETDLRWALRLKAELVRSQHGLLLRTLEARLGRSIEEVRAVDLSALVTLGVRAIGEAIDAHDPLVGAGRMPGRLAAPAGLAIDRGVARWVKEHEHTSGPRGRATPRLGAGALADWTADLATWQAWIDPDPRVRVGAQRLGDPSRGFLLRRFGWDGGPPATLDQMSVLFGLTRIAVVARERELRRAAVQKAREVGVAG